MSTDSTKTGTPTIDSSKIPPMDDGGSSDIFGSERSTQYIDAERSHGQNQKISQYTNSPSEVEKAKYYSNLAKKEESVKKMVDVFKWSIPIALTALISVVLFLFGEFLASTAPQIATNIESIKNLKEKHTNDKEDINDEIDKLEERLNNYIEKDTE